MLCQESVPFDVMFKELVVLAVTRWSMAAGENGLVLHGGIVRWSLFPHAR